MSSSSEIFPVAPQPGEISAHDASPTSAADAKFRTVFDQGIYFACVMNVDGTLSEANRVSLEACGYSRRDVIGKKFWDCGWWNRSSDLMDIIHEASNQAANGVLFRGELEYYMANGGQRQVDLTIAPAKDEAGQVLFLIPTGIDITERKEAEAAVNERIRLAALRAGISSALVSSDSIQEVLQHCTDAMVQYMNAAFARIWTLNEADNVLELMASSGLYTHIDGPHGRVKVGDFKIGRIAKNARALLTNDVLHDPNVSNPDWARKEGMVSFAGYPMMLDGRVVGVMAMFARRPFSTTAFTELEPIAGNIAQWIQRKRTEEVLREAQNSLAQQNRILDQTVQERTAELQETIMELQAFSYSISHDMRSPLRAMQGYADALLEDYKEKLEPEAVMYLERIQRGATRLDLLIRDVLAYSKVARGDIQLQPLSLDHLIADITQNYPNLHPSLLKVEVTALPRVWAHEGLVTQIVSNLLGNAVKFAAPGAFPKVRISSEPKGDQVRIWFRDNGIGIAPSHHRQIFQIFGRVYPEKQFEGTGIGLAIVRKAAERMGGAAGVCAELGQGSRFWVDLKPAP